MNKIQRPAFERLHRSAQATATHDLRSAAPMPTTDLQPRKPINASKTLVVHVLVALDCVALVIFKEPPAAVLEVLLRDLRQARCYGCVTLRLTRWQFARRTTSSMHAFARFALAQTGLLQGLHGFGSPGRLQEFFRIRSSIASILIVCRAMMRCICAFSASSALSRARSVAVMPLYLVRHNRIVFA